jgi:hypothetical protein
MDNGMAGDRPVHLVGSVPLASAADVFRAAAEAIGPRLARIPDGETGERLGWVAFQLDVFGAHPSFEREPPAGERGPGGTDAVGYRRGLYRLKPGVDAAEVTFGDLGYAAAALASYATFAELKAAGLVGDSTRFQVSLPTPRAPLFSCVTQSEIEVVLPAYRAAMLRELAQVCAEVPAAELAVQWDVAREIGLLEGVFPAEFAGDPLTVVTGSLVELGDAVPSEVPMGYHFCYGDFGHRHFVQPKDLALVVGLANRVAAELSRPLSWLHVPVPRDRDDADYFAPLRSLRLPPETELYLGLVHATDGLAGARRRMRTAAAYRGRFGVGTECGLGRRDPDTVPGLLALHREVAEAR